MLVKLTTTNQLTRTVLDTNVLISTLVFQSGAQSWLRRAWTSRRILPLASYETVMELLRVLAYPKFALSVDKNMNC